MCHPGIHRQCLSHGQGQDTESAQHEWCRGSLPVWGAAYFCIVKSILKAAPGLNQSIGNPFHHLVTLQFRIRIEPFGIIISVNESLSDKLANRRFRPMSLEISKGILSLYLLQSSRTGKYGRIFPTRDFAIRTKRSVLVTRDQFFSYALAIVA